MPEYGDSGSVTVRDGILTERVLGEAWRPCADIA